MKKDPKHLNDKFPEPAPVKKSPHFVARNHLRTAQSQFDRLVRNQVPIGERDVYILEMCKKIHPTGALTFDEYALLAPGKTGPEITELLDNIIINEERNLAQEKARAWIARYEKEGKKKYSPENNPAALMKALPTEFMRAGIDVKPFLNGGKPTLDEMTEMVHDAAEKIAADSAVLAEEMKSFRTGRGASRG